MIAELPEFYQPDVHQWLYFGWENEWPKALSFMGGGLCPNRMKPMILYSVTVGNTEYTPDEHAENRRDMIRWYKAENYLNSPISEWAAGNTALTVRIQHTANRVCGDTATVIFTRVTLTNGADTPLAVTLNINADAKTEVPLNCVPDTGAADGLSAYSVTVPAKDAVSFEFAALANGTLSAGQLSAVGGFDENFACMKTHYEELLAELAQPVTLPSRDLADSYKSSIVTMLESMTRTEAPVRIDSVRNVTLDGAPADILPLYETLPLYTLWNNGGNGEKTERLRLDANECLVDIFPRSRLILNGVPFSRDCRFLSVEISCPLSTGAAQGGILVITLDDSETPCAVFEISETTSGWDDYMLLSVPCAAPIPAGAHKLTLSMLPPAGSDKPLPLYNVGMIYAVTHPTWEKVPENLRKLCGMIPAGRTVSAEVRADVVGVACRLLLAGGDFKTVYADETFETGADFQTVTFALPDTPREPVLYLMIGTTYDYEIRGSGGNLAGCYQYDRTFSHDVPNMADQFVRDGHFELAKRIFASTYYQKLAYRPEQNYLDAIPKYIIPYATLWQLMSGEERKAYFVDPVREQIRSAAHAISGYMAGPMGLMAKSNTLDNGSDHLLVDNFAVLHGYAAYRYLCLSWGDAWSGEAEWAEERLQTLNHALNRALEESMERRGTDWYMCALDDTCGFWQRHINGSVIYDGNWLGTTFMMSTFPWDAQLSGMDVGGTWLDALDVTLDNAVALKRQRGDIPENSWGAWWGHEYGSIYNVGMSIGLLTSEKYRTSAVRCYEWLLENQTAPMVWGESFSVGKSSGDWTLPAADLETWGLGFNRQGLLEATVSVRANGDLIIGRGIPPEWTKPGCCPIEWKNIRIGDGRRFDTLKIETADDGNTITVTFSGDSPKGQIVIDLPVLAGTVVSASVGTVDRTLGTVTVPNTTKRCVLSLR